MRYIFIKTIAQLLRQKVRWHLWLRRDEICEQDWQCNRTERIFIILLFPGFFNVSCVLLPFYQLQSFTPMDCVRFQVNAELKKLLVASVGDDLQYRVEKLAR